MRWIVRGALLFILAFANLNDIWSPDVVPNTLLVWSLAREGDLDLDEFTIPEGAPTGPGYAGIPRQTYYFRACGISTFTGTPSAPRSLGGPPPPGPSDHVCSIFPPGISLLADAVARRTGLPVVRAIRRFRHARPQVELDRAERARNVEGAFVGCAGALAGMRVALVDDVATTGATCAAAASAVRASGARSVRAYLVAIDE